MAFSECSGGFERNGMQNGNAKGGQRVKIKKNIEGMSEEKKKKKLPVAVERNEKKKIIITIDN